MRPGASCCRPAIASSAARPSVGRRSDQWTREQIDVAEALAAQASVALENGRLDQEAREAYEGLRAAQAKIIQAEKLAVVGTLASGLAHEVRNPLNSIALQLSLLERRIGRIDNGLADEMRDLTGVIREEIRRLDSLVGDFLVFSRTKRVETDLRHRLPPGRGGSSPPTRGPIFRDHAAPRTKGRYAPSGADRHREDEAGGDQPREERPRGDVGRGGGIVTVESGSVDDRARITVRDTGPGLPPGIDIFQLFVTTKATGHGPRPAHRATDRPRARGRGHGLQHAGRGRDVHHQPPDVGTSGAHQQRSKVMSKGKVIVIDDEVNAAAALETLLTEDGYEVWRATTPARDSSSSRGTSPTWCSRTCACRGWTASSSSPASRRCDRRLWSSS